MTKLLFHILFKNTMHREKKVTAMIETGDFLWYDGIHKNCCVYHKGESHDKFI